MNKVEKIKTEIERLKSSLPWGSCASQLSMECNCKNEAYNEVLSYINSLEEEPVSNDLEEAAHSYVDTTIEWFDSEGNPCCYPAFIAGAQWQKQQDQLTIELAEDHAMLAGMEKMKEEMIDKFFKWLAKHWREYVWLTDNNVIHFGHWEYDLKRAMEE